MRKVGVKPFIKKGDLVIVNTGFQKLHPFITIDSILRKPIKPNETLTVSWMKFIKDEGPFRFFITLTFGSNIGIQRICSVINKFIYNYNRKIFTHHFYNKPGWRVEGFAFIEKHTSGVSNNENHVHILIKSNDRYKDHNDIEHNDIFRKAARRVLDERDKRVFNDKCIDIRHAGDDGRIVYCMEEIWDKNLYRIKMIGKDGINDNQDDNN